MSHKATPPAAATIVSDAPDESSFIQHAGQTKRVVLANGTATVEGRFSTPKATYVRLRVKPDFSLAGGILRSVTDGAGRPLVAAAYSDQGTAYFSGAELLLRITSTVQKQELRSLKWTARSSPDGTQTNAGYEQTVSIPPIDDAPVQADLERRFGEAMSAWFRLRGNGEPFMAFAASRISHRLVKPSPAEAATQRYWTNSPTELASLMDFYTGRSSVRDSLQTGRGLQIRTKPAALTIDPTSLGTQAAIAQNYDQLVERGMPAGLPVVSPLAGAIPNDVMVIEFATLKDMIQLPRQLDQKLGAIVRVAEGAGGPNHLVERYRAQLGIELDGFAETVGQFAVKSAAVVLGDPYLREGTDMSLVFRAENQALLGSVLANHLARAKSRFPDVVTTQETLAGEPVALTTVPDGALRRYEYYYGDVRIVSNSRAAMTRFIQVKQGKQAKLAEDRGYLGARRLAPYNPDRERAFLFFGDAFVANAVGPRSRILEARRMRAQSELEAVDNLALLYGWLEGKPAKTKADLLESGWAEKSDFAHADGSPIEWTSTKGAHSRWGYAKGLIPIADIPFDKISKDEADAYSSFRSWYTGAMEGRLDPTSFRVERTANEQGIATELRVFPIMQSGTFQREFRQIARMVGDGRVTSGEKTRGVTVTMGIGEGSPLRAESDNLIRHFFGRKDLSVDFVGDWVEAGWDEGSALWDIAAGEGEISNIQSNNLEGRPRVKFDEIVPKLPVWAAIQIKSRLLLAAALTAVRLKVEESAEGLVKWQKDTTYRNVPITRVQARENDEADGIRANIYYAVAKDVFLVGLRREILKARIDDVLDGRAPKGAKLPQSPTQFALNSAPTANGWQRRTAQAWLDKAALSAHERACDGLEVLTRGLVTMPTSPSEKRDTALRFLGYEPESPQSGELAWHDGLCEHAVYGTTIEPRVPDAKDPSVPLHGALSAIESLNFALGLIPRGNATELWARFRWNPTTAK